MSTFGDYDLDYFMRSIAESAVAHLTRAFENAQVPDGRGGFIHARAAWAHGDQMSISYQKANAKAWGSDTEYRLGLAYAWYSSQFQRGLNYYAPLDWAGGEQNERVHGKNFPGFEIVPVMFSDYPESALGLEVWRIGRAVRANVDTLKSKKHPSGWGVLGINREIVETVRTELNWPMLHVEFVPPAPNKWPEVEAF